MKIYKPDDFAISVYGQENYTIKEGIESGKLKVVKQEGLTIFDKPKYFAMINQVFGMQIDGRFARKYLKED